MRSVICAVVYCNMTAKSACSTAAQDVRMSVILDFDKEIRKFIKLDFSQRA